MESDNTTKPGTLAKRRPRAIFNGSRWPTRSRAAAMAKGATLAGMALAVLLALEVVLERQGEVGEPVAVPDEGPKLFSRKSRSSSKSDIPGCLNPATDTYTWRLAGWGSNINTLLLQWAEGLVSGRTDLAVIFDSNWPWFEQTTCEHASGGVETIGGWGCIFQQMPHLCIYNNQQEWEGALTPLAVSRIEKGQAKGRMGDIYARRNRHFLRHTLLGTGIDDMSALAALLDYIYSNFQPWFEDAVEAILDEPRIAALGHGKYVGMHIRRTDKILSEAKKTETVRYFEVVANYLNATVHGPALTDISGVWLSSDDESVFAEVQDIAPQYFPNVDAENVIFISGRVPLENNTSSDLKALLKGAQSRNYDVKTSIQENVRVLCMARIPFSYGGYDAVVLLMAELRMLARADVFSGTFTSNIGRMVVLMRKSLHKPKKSAVAADKKRWRSG